MKSMTRHPSSQIITFLGQLHQKWLKKNQDLPIRGWGTAESREIQLEFDFRSRPARRWHSSIT